MKRYIMSHVPMAVVYALVVSVLRGGWWPLSTTWAIDQIWWVVGVVIGVLIVYLDRFAYIYSFPGEQLSQQANWYIKEKKYMAVFALLDSRRHEQIKLTFRSALFIVAWIPLAFFAITSTTSPMGKGVVLGVMLHILLDSWRVQRESPEKLNTRLFWQIGRDITQEQQIVFMWIVSFIFVFFSYWGR